MPASCCVRFSWVGGGQTTQSAYMLSAPWAAGLASRAQRCLSDVRLWCLYRNNLVPRRSCVLGALEATQGKYLRGPKVRSMVLASSAERSRGPPALIIFFKRGRAWECELLEKFSARTCIHQNAGVLRVAALCPHVNPTCACPPPPAPGFSIWGEVKPWRVKCWCGWGH